MVFQPDTPGGAGVLLRVADIKKRMHVQPVLNSKQVEKVTRCVWPFVLGVKICDPH